MEVKVILTILLIIGLLIGFAVMVYLHIRDKTLEQIRAEVYQYFLYVEHEFQHGDNEQKFEYVIQLARSLLPGWAGIFITENLLRKIVQLWFDGVKDLLDDGKYNQSSKGDE